MERLLFTGWLEDDDRVMRSPQREGHITTSPRSRSGKNAADAKLVKDLAKHPCPPAGPTEDETVSLPRVLSPPPPCVILIPAAVVDRYLGLQPVR